MFKREQKRRDKNEEFVVEKNREETSVNVMFSE